MIIYEAILKEFQKQKVKYVLVGGIAANLLGARRTTSDLDILVEMSDLNLAKVVNILKKQRYHVKQPVDPIGIADKKTRDNWINNKHMKTFNFYKDNDFRQVDIIIDSPVSYEQAKEDAILINAGDIKLKVISINKLIKMKRKAGREIDKLDIKELMIAKRSMEKK